jgi:GMP synthase PP-ATPase subunit
MNAVIPAAMARRQTASILTKTLGHVATRIINEVKDVNRVVYDVT